MDKQLSLESLEQSFAEIESLLELSEEELEKVQPILVDHLSNALTGPEAMLGLEESAKLYDTLGYSYQQIAEDFERGKDWTYGFIIGLKEKYSDSAIKQEILDMIYSLIETYFNIAIMYYVNRNEVNLGIEFVHPDAQLPTYAHEGDQGADVYAIEDFTIAAHTYGNVVPTGLKLLIPGGWAISIRPRSGMSKNTTLRISNSPATIDQQYRGEVKILFDNIGDEPVFIKKGERIAQFILEKNYQAKYLQVDTVEPSTERGEGGFGSTGV